MVYKQKGFTAFTQKDDKKKTYPKHYTEEDVKFLEEQNEDIVRYEDLDEKGKAIWEKQGKPRYWKNLKYKITKNPEHLKK